MGSKCLNYEQKWNFSLFCVNKKMIIFFLRKILSVLLANQGIGGLLCSAWGGLALVEKSNICAPQ